jgi:hypothetical protein
LKLIQRPDDAYGESPQICGNAAGVVVFEGQEKIDVGHMHHDYDEQKPQPKT